MFYIYIYIYFTLFYFITLNIFCIECLLSVIFNTNLLYIYIYIITIVIIIVSFINIFYIFSFSKYIVYYTIYHSSTSNGNVIFISVALYSTPSPLPIYFVIKGITTLSCLRALCELKKQFT